jgi:hypothetical protein
MTPSPRAPGGAPLSAVLTGAGSALPATLDQDAVWDGFFARTTRASAPPADLRRPPGCARRHAVANPVDEDLSGWGTGARMERYVQEALPLGKQAVAGALDAPASRRGRRPVRRRHLHRLRHARAGHPAGQRPGHAARAAAAAGRAHGLLRRDPGLAAVGDFVTARSARPCCCAAS